MEDKNILGNKIKIIREKQNITQDNLAARLNVQGIEIDRPMISKIENKTRYLLDYEIKGIAKALNIDVNELFKGL